MAGPDLRVDVSDSGAVSLQANDAPLADIIEALERADLLVVVACPTLDARVSARGDGMPLQPLLGSLLRGYSYTLSEATTGDPARLWVHGIGSDTPLRALLAKPKEALMQATADLGDDDPEVRLEAVLVLGDIGGRDARALVQSVLHDASGDVREAAAAVLEDLDEAAAGSPTD